MTFPPFRLQRRQCASAGNLPGRSGKETLRFPLPVPARLAIIDAQFHLAAHMRAFDSLDIHGLVHYAPDAMALPVDTALSIADRKLRGLLDLPSLKLAIVVFSSVDLLGAFETHHRDLLWKVFGLPVFEQLRGATGEVIARECEVHDGLHLDADMRAGIRDEIVTGQCDCGLETPRLLHRKFGTRTRAAAA